MPIQWSATYELGVASLDNEHQILVTLYNDLVRAIARGTSLNLRRACLASIRNWAALHFHNEERMIDGPGVAEHAEDHRSFVTDVARLHDMAADDRALCNAAHALRQRLLDHFQADRSLFDALRPCGRMAR